MGTMLTYGVVSAILDIDNFFYSSQVIATHPFSKASLMYISHVFIHAMDHVLSWPVGVLNYGLN